MRSERGREENRRERERETVGKEGEFPREGQMMEWRRRVGGGGF